MKVNTLSRKLVKPSVPTPLNLRNYQISLVDEFSPGLNINPILYYPSLGSKERQQTLEHLEEALALVLPKFYPLAGRYVEKDRLVDCSDQGVEFVIAEADRRLLELIKDCKNHDELDDLLPRQIYLTDPVMSIQVTMFECGGVAICVSVSHRIMDGSSVGMFLASWSNLACNHMHGGGATVLPYQETTINPSFDSPKWFPRGENPGDSSDWNKLEIGSKDSSCGSKAGLVSRRLVFRKEAIARASDVMNKPNDDREIGKIQGSVVLTRVRLVTALITTALISVDRVRWGRSRTTLVAQAVNIRGRTIPPLPKHSCGNLSTVSITEISTDAADDQKEKGFLGFGDYVRALGKANKKTIEECAKLLSPGADAYEIMVRPGRRVVERQFGGDPANVVWVTDWTKFGFYEVDFGWGKPVWASAGTMVWENLVILMEGKEADGIEAWVPLRPEHVPSLEQVLQEEIKPLIS